MATREQLIEDFADHKLATGEKFVNLINSMKVVQEPVEDPAASGTSLSFIDSVSQNADGKITATKKTLDLANAHELNPFKGWYKTGDTLPTSGFDGAYLYFKDTSELTGQTTIYRWNGTTYADTGTVVDTSNVQTFETGQAVNETAIDNTMLVNPTDNALAKATDMMRLAAKLEGVTRTVEKVTLIDNDTYFNVKYVGSNKKINTSQSYPGDTPTGIIIVNVEGYDKVRFLGVEKTAPTSIGYGFSTNAIDPTSTAVQLDTVTTFRADAAQDKAVEYIVDVPEGMKWFACTVYTFATAGITPLMTRDDFYCYKIKGSLPINTDMVDSVPLPHSENFVKSGGLYNELNITTAINLDGLTRTNYAINGSTNKWVISNNYESVILPVIPMEKYSIKSSNTLWYAWLKNNNATVDTNVNYADDTTLAYIYQQEVTLTVPEDAHFMYLLVNNGGTNAIPQSFIRLNGSLKEVVKGLVSSNEVGLAMPEFILGKYIPSAHPIPSSMNYAKEQGCDTSVNYCAVTNSVCMLPYRGVTLHINVPDGMVALIKFLTNPTVYDVYSQAFEGKSTYKVNEKYIAFIIDLYHPGTDKNTADETRSIDIDDVNDMVESGEFSITYERERLNVREYLLTVVKPWDGTTTSRGRGNGTGDSYKKYATFLHVSDIHGDSTRWRNALDAATELGVDAVINTGDSCQLSAVNGMGYIDSIGKDYAVPQLITVGNHDACKTGTPDSTTHITLIGTTAALTNQELYEEAVEPYYVKNGYQLPSDTDYDTAPTYWYKDFTEKKIRYISINEYEEGRVAPNGKTIFYGSRISQKQIDWLCNTLLSTPAGYGVLIAVHSTPCPIVKPSVKGITGKDDFCQTLLLEYTATSDSAGATPPSNYRIFGMTPVSPNPLVTLVDKFIEKQAAQFTYTNAISTGTETVTVDADFSAVNSGVEFIAWVAGHGHFDYCSYIRDSDELQLILMITTANALYPYYNITAFAECCDLYRGEGRGEIQDAYNVYCIDRDRKEVRIGKGGSNLTVELKERKMLVLPYAETNN